MRTRIAGMYAAVLLLGTTAWGSESSPGAGRNANSAALASSVASSQRTVAATFAPPAAVVPARLVQLDAAAAPYRMEKAPIAAALFALGRTYGFTVVVEPDVTGDVTFETQGGSVRDVLTTIAGTGGYFAEESSGLVTVKKMKTVLYLIEYPQIQRKSSGTSSVSISTGTRYGAMGNGGVGSYGIPAIANTTAGDGTNGNGMQGSGGSDQNSFQITKENENSFWDDIATELKSFLREDETVFVNRFSGIAAVSARPHRHEQIKAFVELLNDRINQQVHIEAQILEVALHGDTTMGVDWSQVATRVGGGFELAGIPGWNGVSIATDTAVRPLNAAVNPTSLNARLQFGKLSALISALQEQGDVRSKSNPKISALNNQTAYIKVGEDDAFFSLSKSTSITTATATTNAATTSENIYSSSTETFGTVLEVTPHVAHSGLITLDVQPVITRLLSIERSPDLQQTRPNKEIKEASTILQLYDGETGLIGGFIYDNATRTSNRVPGLGSIPGVGRLFRTDSTGTRHTEVIILLTATVARKRR